MIREFKNLEARDSAVIYQSGLMQIKKLFAQDPILAGELAICMCEVALTGEHSSDNPLIDIMLENLKVSAVKNKQRYERAQELKREKYIRDNKLTDIVELMEQGVSQTEIARRLGITKQAVSKKVRKIREDYPELLSTGIENLVDEEEESSQPILVDSQPKSRNSSQPNFIMDMKESTKFYNESTKLVDREDSRSQPESTNFYIVSTDSVDSKPILVDSKPLSTESQLNLVDREDSRNQPVKVGYEPILSTSQPKSTKILVDKSSEKPLSTESTKVNWNVNVNVNDNVNVQPAPPYKHQTTWGGFDF